MASRVFASITLSEQCKGRNSFASVNLEAKYLSSFSGHDDADYNSDEDPDYVPPNDVADDSDDKMQE